MISSLLKSFFRKLPEPLFTNGKLILLSKLSDQCCCDCEGYTEGWCDRGGVLGLEMEADDPLWRPLKGAAGV